MPGKGEEKRRADFSAGAVCIHYCSRAGWGEHMARWAGQFIAFRALPGPRAPMEPVEVFRASEDCPSPAASAARCHAGALNRTPGRFPFQTSPGSWSPPSQPFPSLTTCQEPHRGLQTSLLRLCSAKPAFAKPVPTPSAPTTQARCWGSQRQLQPKNLRKKSKPPGEQFVFDKP